MTLVIAMVMAENMSLNLLIITELTADCVMLAHDWSLKTLLRTHFNARCNHIENSNSKEVGTLYEMVKKTECDDLQIS